MPGRDRTGPVGMGSRTGKGMGVCAGASDPGYASPPQGRGRMMQGGRGIGRGVGRGRCGGGFGGGFGRGMWKMPDQTGNPESTDNKEE